MPILFNAGPRLGPEEFRLLRDLFNKVSGMEFTDASRPLFERRLQERIVELGVDSFKAYYQHLRYDPRRQDEIEAATELLVTNETYFFREAYQLQALADEIIPKMADRAEAEGKRALTIWSAGCSTGEEAYTLAILVSEMQRLRGWDVRIFGSDISRRVLGIARNAVYREASFRAMPPRYRRYFREVRGGMQVRPEIRSLCHFGHLNLLQRERAAIIGRAHVVLCRNVLIYFDEKARRRVVETFYDRLVPGGYLLLGHSESLLHTSTAFELVHLSTDMVYRRPVLTEALR